jgi:hypothetical protein
MDATDKRWLAVLQYTTDDDGIWIVLGEQRTNLGFWPSVEDVLRAAEELQPQTAGGCT